MSSSVNEANLEKKFKGVTNTQDCIQTLSLWILHHKAHHKIIVESWMKVLQKAKINHRLAMFYLANDVVQNGKRKNVPQFGNSFAEVLREATLLVRDEKIRPSIERVFNIWEQRGVYESDFIADLKAILANTKVPASAPSKLLSEFKHESVIEKIRSVLKMQMEISKKITTINLSKLNATNAEIVQQLKDRVHGQQFSKDFDDSTKCLEDLIKTMNAEIKERTELILKLEQSEIYYDTQRGEAKIVANAYKNFGGRVKTLQKKLEELTASFPSPVPSPSPDAPSPTTSDLEMELNLPNDKEQSGMTSWLDTFSKKKKTIAVAPKTEHKKSDPSSLDSRLSNLLQNIPNLPAGLQNTLLGNSITASNSKHEDDTSSHGYSKKRKTSPIPVLNTGSTTPTKDECSGQNTPLQDEDSHSVNQPAFFSSLASNAKTHNSDNVLKSLSHFIPPTDGTLEISDSSKDGKFPYDSPDRYSHEDSISSKRRKSSSHHEKRKHSGSPSSFYSSSQGSPIRTIPMSGNTSTYSYDSSPFNEASAYSGNSSTSNINENLSFIPSLVPSTPHDGSFDYTSENFPLDEYNPEIENFEIDMDIESDIVLHDQDVPSPEMLGDTRSPSPDIPQPSSRPSGRRLSTLITVVTEDAPKKSIPSDDKLFSSSVSYEKEDAKSSPSDWSESASVPKDSNDLPSENMSQTDPIPSAEEFPNDQDLRVPFFVDNPPPDATGNTAPANDNSPAPQPSSPEAEWSMSKIETVQSHRKNMDWLGNNNWTSFESERTRNVPVEYPYRAPFRPPEYTFDKRNYHPNFHPRNNWNNHRERPDMQFPPPYGPPPNRFPFRGRGWGRRQPQY